MTNLFTHRSEETEIMDDLFCSGHVVDQTLWELDKINRWLGGNHVSIEALGVLLSNSKYKSETITIADLGCGSGEMLRLINRWMSRNNYPVFLTGIDANPYIIIYAKNHLKHLSNIELLATSIFSEEFKMRQFDIVVSTLFLHHFSSGQLKQFFRQLKQQVRIGFIINDIHRHWFAYHSIRLITKFFSRSSMVKNDAPLSVLRAFSKAELNEILSGAGITNYIIRWRWAFRWQVVVFTD